jgi:hypothetical protein
MRQAELLPLHIFQAPQFEQACRLQSLVQRNNATAAPGARGRPHNAEACLNAFSRFFKLIASPACSFLTACLLQPDFDEIRSSGIKAMRRGFLDRHPRFPLETLTNMLGCDDVDDCADLCRQCGLEIVPSDMADEPTDVILHRGVTFTDFNKVTATPRAPSQRLVGSKRGTVKVEAIIDGLADPHIAAPAVFKTSPKATFKTVSPQIKMPSTFPPFAAQPFPTPSAPKDIIQPTPFRSRRHPLFCLRPPEQACPVPSPRGLRPHRLRTRLLPLRCQSSRWRRRPRRP